MKIEYIQYVVDGKETKRVLAKKSTFCCNKLEESYSMLVGTTGLHPMSDRGTDTSICYDYCPYCGEKVELVEVDRKIGRHVKYVEVRKIKHRKIQWE